MLAMPEDGSEVLMQPYLTKSDVRGCSDFLFVPGTNDTHIFMLRTEESMDGTVNTYGSVIDLTARVLMEEVLVGTERKFEGCAWVGGFGPFPVSGPAEGMVIKPPPMATEPTPQSAFVFIKPHANTPAVQELVKAKFGEVGIKILSDGEIGGEKIDSDKLIDQHYYAIASKVQRAPRLLTQSPHRTRPTAPPVLHARPTAPPVPSPHSTVACVCFTVCVRSRRRS